MRHLRVWITVGLVAALDVKAGVTFEKSQPAPYNFTERYPHFTWGAMVGVESNRTATPRIVSAPFGKSLDTKVFTIPGADTIVVESASTGPSGGLAVCGTAYDSTGKASGFLGLLSPGDASFRVIRLYPYFPHTLAVASDGSIWTSGDEMIDSDPHAPGLSPQLATLRHFDSLGKLLQGLVPRDSLQSVFAPAYGYLQAAQGRIGWYTGPFSGPGSLYFEVSQDGKLTAYPGVDLHQLERVTGIALAANGRTYATTFERRPAGERGIPHFFSIGPGETAWRPEKFTIDTIPNPSVHLYGADGDELVFWKDFRGDTIFLAHAQ